MEGNKPEFLGLPDDLARLGVQRLMTCDVRWRAYDRAARVWQRTATVVGALAAIAASMAAVSFVQNVIWLAITLSISVAVLVPLQNTVNASGHAADNREAAARFERLANDFERYVQLDLGPPMWRGKLHDINRLRAELDDLDARLTSASSNTPRVRFRTNELESTEGRARHLLEYLRMPNVTLPKRPVWA